MTGSRSLPVLTNVQLRNFSLYQNNRNLSIPILPGVFCLAGANGMGKSTFLAAINYALTGTVPNPRRAFRSVENFYKDSLAFAPKYFDGRVEQEDRPIAEIELHFRIADHRYRIVKNFFESEALREFEMEDPTGHPLVDTSASDPRARHSAYQNRIVEDCNLAGFEYFVFLQQMLLTFDERRHLLFWDPRAANLALYLAFGVEPSDTERSEKLRLGIDSAESNARNAQWQATIARNSLARMGGSDVAGLLQLRDTHEQLVEALSNAEEEAALAERAADDAVLAAAGAAANQQALRREYDRAFARKVAGNRDPARHPVILQSLSDHTCDVCGSTSDEAIAAIRAALNEQRCPLCCTPIQHAEPQNFDELQELDDELAIAKAESETAQARAERLQLEAQDVQARALSAAAAVEKFEQANAEGMAKIISASPESEHQRRTLEAEARNAVKRRDEFRRQRDAMHAELEPLQARLSSAYHAGELEFVPTFRRFAKRFIGLEIDVYLNQIQNTFGLSLEMKGSRRQTTTELSESQRFFLEIALKMALAQHMSSTDSPAALLIDTPEGSLDIAYEARAGDMFADYVQAGFNLLMTANINSSQLLKRLAERCKAEDMELVRMTEWAPLTEVQAAEEHLFNEAYADIENRLIGGAEATEQ